MTTPPAQIGDGIRAALLGAIQPEAAFNELDRILADLQQVKDAYRDKRTEAEYHANDVEALRTELQQAHAEIRKTIAEREDLRDEAGALRTENERYRALLRRTKVVLGGKAGNNYGQLYADIAQALAPTTQEDRHDPGPPEHEKRWP